MAESTDETTTNSSPSDCDSDDYPINRLPLVIDQHEQHINDEFGLFNNDDEDNLTLFDLKATPRLDHDFSVFDELAHQCNAVLLSTNCHSTTAVIRAMNSANLPSTTMNNEYQRRFQHSLQKLTIPSWYNDTLSTPKLSKKPPMIISTTPYNQGIPPTLEIVHVHRPHSYRSCRSSLGTSPSPSVHSWHPNHLFDGMNCSSLLPSSSSISRRSNKYEKGIQRVIKSSHWYQPTQFLAVAKEPDQTSTSKVRPIEREKSNYDRTKSTNLEKKFSSMTKQIPRISIQRQANCLSDDTDFDDVENTNSIKQNNNYYKDDILMTYDKQHDNEILIMPLAKESSSFTGVELEEISDEEENDKRSTTSNNRLAPSTVKENDDRTQMSLERLANDLVDSILTEVLLSKSFESDEINVGVRELSDDENGLRELDVNDMSGTDEFILFAAKAELSDDENPVQELTNQPSPSINRGSTNRLYTFSRSNDDGTINNSKKQDSSTSELMFVDKDTSPTNSHANPLVDANDDQSKTSLPIYRSHIQKRQINLGRYYDGMMRGKSSQLPTHDLRCNLHLYQPSILPPVPPSEGVTEETVRQGRILLDQIPNVEELKSQCNESAPMVPVRSILKNTRFSPTDETENQPVLQIDEREMVSPCKITTMITEEYHRIQRKIIEEFEGEVNEAVHLGSNYSHNQERTTNSHSLTPSVPRTDQSPYELLSECYSGYSSMRVKYSLPLKSPLTPNVSSLHTTTDEAYESEATVSPRSPTMSSSTAPTATTSPTAHVHPELEHEFEYPSPAPPVPDRRLKPAHLRPPPPPTKPRHSKQQTDSTMYSKIQKQNKISPLTAIRNLITSNPDQSTYPSARTLSSRHYCGSIPASNEPLISSSSEARTKTTGTSQENSKTRSLSSHDHQQVKFRKSSTSSLTKTRSKKSSSAYFDETTNGLAIRLPASEPTSTNKQYPNRSSTSAGKRTDGTTKHRPLSENLNPDRSSTYETSV